MEKTLFLLSFFVFDHDRVAILGKKFSRDLCASINNDWIYEEAILHAVEKTVTKCRNTAFTAKRFVGIEQLAPFHFTRIFLGKLLQLLQVIFWRSSQSELVADEILEHRTGISIDGAMRLIG